MKYYKTVKSEKLNDKEIIKCPFCDKVNEKENKCEHFDGIMDYFNGAKVGFFKIKTKEFA